MKPPSHLVGATRLRAVQHKSHLLDTISLGRLEEEIDHSSSYVYFIIYFLSLYSYIEYSTLD
jgi:hypothetical protein